MRLPAVAVSLLALACSTTELEFDVDHYQVPCVSDELRLCLLTKDGSSNDWALFRDPIDGYTHEWGVLDRLRVTERTGIDGVNSSYSLVEVVQSEPVPPETSFLYPFRPDDEKAEGATKSVVTSDGGGTLLDGKRFVCADEEVCQDLDDGLNARTTVVLALSYGDPVEGDLLLTGVSLTAQ